MSLDVVDRTREIGVRRAVGGSPFAVTRMIVVQAARPVVIGIGLGVATSLFVARMAEGLLQGVSPWDPLTLLGTGAALLGVGLIAAYLPAARATRIPPMDALRVE